VGAEAPNWGSKVITVLYRLRTFGHTTPCLGDCLATVTSSVPVTESLPNYREEANMHQNVLVQTPDIFDLKSAEVCYTHETNHDISRYDDVFIYSN
jgi:hypothetical protein